MPNVKMENSQHSAKVQLPYGFNFKETFSSQVKITEVLQNEATNGLEFLSLSTGASRSRVLCKSDYCFLGIPLLIKFT
jgi:hypothetical protein